MKNDIKYLNFPVSMLSGFMDNPKKVISNIMDYAVYEHSLKLDLNEDEVARFKDAAKWYGIKFGNIENAFDNGEQLFEYLDQYSHKPMVGISKEMAFEYYKNGKDEFQLISLLAFLGIKSIVGKKAYCNISNISWLSRMAGYSRKVNHTDELPKPIRKYATKYYTGKIKKELQLNWYVKAYHKRGTYFSFDLSIENLAFEVEKRSKKNKERVLQNEKAKAKQNALKRLYG